METHYSTLALNLGATISQIRSSYHRLALSLHPDKNFDGDDEPFKRLVNAYEVLNCPIQRAIYDASLPASAASVGVPLAHPARPAAAPSRGPSHVSPTAPPLQRYGRRLPDDPRLYARIVEAAYGALHLRKSREHRRVDVRQEKISRSAVCAAAGASVARRTAPLQEAAVTELLRRHRVYPGWRRSVDFPTTTVYGDVSRIAALLPSQLPHGMLCVGVDGTNAISSRITGCHGATSAATQTMRESYRSESVMTVSLSAPGKHSNDDVVILGGVLDHEGAAKLDAIITESGLVEYVASKGLRAYLLVDGGMVLKLFSTAQKRCPLCLRSLQSVTDDPELTTHPVICAGGLADLCLDLVVGIGHSLCTILTRVLLAHTGAEYAAVDPLVDKVIGIPVRRGVAVKLDIEHFEALFAAGIADHVAPRWKRVVDGIGLFFKSSRLPDGWRAIVADIHHDMVANGEGTFTMFSHMVGHTFQWCYERCGGDLDCVRENVVERVNQIIKGYLRHYSGDLLMSYSAHNATLSLRRVDLRDAATC